MLAYYHLNISLALFVASSGETSFRFSCNLRKVPAIGHLLAGPPLNHGCFVLGLSNGKSSAGGSIQDVKEPRCLMV